MVVPAGQGSTETNVLPLASTNRTFPAVSNSNSREGDSISQNPTWTRPVPVAQASNAMGGASRPVRTNSCDSTVESESRSISNFPNELGFPLTLAREKVSWTYSESDRSITNVSGSAWHVNEAGTRCHTNRRDINVESTGNR